MATVRDVVTDSLTELGVLAAGETAPAGDADLGLRTLNRLVDMWAAVRLMIHTVTRTTATLTANQSSFTVGPSGNINIARPMFLERIGFVDTSTDPDTEYPLTLLTEQGWADVTLKALTGTYPQAAYYNPTNTTGTLWPWPIPTSATLQWVLYHWAAVAEFASLSDTVALPPGYREMLVTNLAVRLAPSFEREVTPALAQQALTALSMVKRSNVRMSDLRFEAAALIGGGRGYGSIRQG
jgi:hypothetical protein